MSSHQAAAADCLKKLAQLYGGSEPGADAIDELCRLAPAVTFAPGEVVFREGDPADRGLFVIAGRLRATFGERTVGESGPGDVVGEAGVFVDGGRRSATLAATEATTCLTLTRDLFQASQRNTALITLEVHLIRLLAGRISQTDGLLLGAWRDAAAGKKALRDSLPWAFGGWAS